MAKKATGKSYQTKPYLGRGRKETLVVGFSEKVQKAKGMVFTNYQGLTHMQIETLKKAAKKAEAEYVVTKNRLMLRALDGVSLSDEEKSQFQQPTATLFIYNDIVEPLKHLAKMVKELQLPVVKFGILEGKSITDKDVAKLATLPALPVLRAQLLGQMQSPIQGLHRALSWNMQSLVMTLSAIAQKKPAGGAAVPADAAPAPSEPTQAEPTTTPEESATESTEPAAESASAEPIATPTETKPEDQTDKEKEEVIT